MVRLILITPFSMLAYVGLEQVIYYTTEVLYK